MDDLERQRDQMQKDVDRMTQQLASMQSQATAAPAPRRTPVPLDHDPSGLYKIRSSSVAGSAPKNPRRRTPRPESLPELVRDPVARASVGSGRRSSNQAARSSRSSKPGVPRRVTAAQRQQLRRKKELEEAAAAAAHRPPPRKARPLAVPPSCQVEDAMIMRNVREQWKNIYYAITASDRNEHVHDEQVSRYGVNTGLLPPARLRKILAGFAIVFSDVYFNHLVSLVDATANGEIDYNLFLHFFKKGSRHEDCHAIKPVTGISVKQAKRMIQEMIENKLPTGPAPLQRCFQHFDRDGSGSIDLVEFKEVLHHKANIAFDDDLLAKVMQDYDDDGTGEIDFRKFCENVLNSKVGQADCVTKVKPSGSKNVVSSDAGTSDHFIRRKIRMAAKDLRLAFKARDASGTGEIPVDQWRAILEKYDINMTDDQFKTIVGQMDVDGDGTITYQEFLAFFKRDLDASTVLKKITGVSIKTAKNMIRMNIENKLPSGPAPLRRCWKYFDTDGSGNIDIDEMRNALLVKANLVFDEQILQKLMREWDDDGTGEIDYRKFCENVMDSHPDDAGGWGSSHHGSSARIPGAEKAKQRTQKMNAAQSANVVTLSIDPMASSIGSRQGGVHSV
eukprot:COSAG05_NODE_3212_length_2239_cov_11.088537_2_plen_617_part_01